MGTVRSSGRPVHTWQLCRRYHAVEICDFAPSQLPHPNPSEGDKTCTAVLPYFDSSWATVFESLTQPGPRADPSLFDG
jgi:hypothetical protein